jgi:hypothetical protein
MPNSDPFAASQSRCVSAMKAKRLPSLELGEWRALDGEAGGPFRLPAHHLVTHGVVLGMTVAARRGFSPS